MDNVTELNFVSGLKNHIKDKTLLLVTHRSSMLALVDRLIVLNAGKIVLDGPKKEVLETLSRAGNKP